MDTEWMTSAEASAALGVGLSRLGQFARDGEVVRSFDRPETPPGRPAYRADSVRSLAARRATGEGWLTSREAADVLGVSVRGFYKLLETHEDAIAVSDSGPTRYGAESVRALAAARQASPRRLLTERQAAARLGVGTAQFRVLVAQHGGLGFNPRTGRYPAGRIDALR